MWPVISCNQQCQFVQLKSVLEVFLIVAWTPEERKDQATLKPKYVDIHSIREEKLNAFENIEEGSGFGRSFSGRKKVQETLPGNWRK